MIPDNTTGNFKIICANLGNLWLKEILLPPIRLYDLVFFMA
jgi:hypothetical protein